MIGSRLERLAPGQEMSERNMAQAAAALDAAKALLQLGLFEQSLTQAYDSARKSATALLERQRLRSRAASSHRNTQDVLRHQMGSRIAKQFGTIRRTRHQQEYATRDSPEVFEREASAAIAFAERLHGEISIALPRVGPFPL